MTTTALVGPLATSASAQVVWQGPGSDWFTGSNWMGGSIPTASDNVIIDQGPPVVIDNAAADAAIVQLGSAGPGTLTISNAGSLLSDDAYIGAIVGTTGTATVSGAGSTWTADGLMTVGVFGSGSLTISSGGVVSNTEGIVGDAPGSDGVVTVTGAGSTWTNTVALTVGNLGNGALTISDGGTVSSADIISIGVNIGSIGSITVDGTNSTLAGGGDLTVGEHGTGELIVSAGGVVSSATSIIGKEAGSSGTVSVSGSNSSWNASAFAVGFAGNGTMAISSGGAATAQEMVIAATATSTGAAIVDGVGSSLGITGTLTVGDGGAGTLTISNGGVVSAVTAFKIADEVGSTGTLNIGAAAGSPAAAAGTLNTTVVTFGSGTGTVNFNHTDSGYVFAARFLGSGTVNHYAGDTSLVSNSAGFTGATNIFGGRLAVNGSLENSVVTISGDGILGGNGVVGGIVANAGGAIAPGNSIGTLTVNGNASFAAGSTYQVEINSAGQSDLIHATGTAAIANGALLNVTKLDAAPLVAGTKYTVLQADGGVTGTFTLTDPSTFLGLTASYDPTHVYLDVIKLKTFASIGVTPNQVATAGAAEGLGAGNGIYDAILMLPTDAAAQAAFDQLSGEVHASAKTVLIDDSRFVRDAALNRLRASSGGVGASNAPVSVMDAYGAYNKVAPTTEQFAIWGQGFGSWGQWNGNGNAARLDRGTGGFIVGMDETAFDTWRVGVFGGYSTTRFSVDARNSSGTSDNYHVGAYGSTNWGSLALRSGFAYAWHDITTTRTVAFAGFSDTLKGSYEAGTAQAFGELAYGFRQASVAFEPFANLAYVNLRTDGFTEKGGAAALASANAVVDTAFTTLGLRASTTFGANTTVRGSLGWRHAYGDTLPAATLAFAGGSPFTVTGVAIAQDAAVLDLGLDFSLTRNAVLGISYGGQFGSDAVDQTVRANFTAKF